MSGLTQKCPDGYWTTHRKWAYGAVMAADGAETIRLFELRSAPTRHLAGQADAVAAACHAMAVRFHRGGKLVVFGTGGSSTDAQHVAVEFVHPVIVGKRALPAISLTTDVATVTGIAERAGVDAIFAHQIRFLADPADIALGIDPDGHSASVLAGLEAARELGLLTVALTGGAVQFRAVRSRPARRSITCWWRRRPIRGWSRRCTSPPITCCGSWCTCSSSSPACSARG